MGLLDALFKKDKPKGSLQAERFLPETDFERKIDEVISRQLPSKDFLLELAESSLCVLSETQDASGILTLTTPDKGTLLPVFTKNARATPAMRLNPKYKYLLTVKIGELLVRMKSTYGLVVNPYWDKNLEWTAEQINALKPLMQPQAKLDLHDVVVSFHSGKATPAEVMKALLACDVGMLAKPVPSSEFIDNVYTKKIGDAVAVSVFSAPEMLLESKNLQTSFQTVVKVTGPELMKLLPNGCGLVINPDTKMAVEYTPSQVRMLGMLMG